MFKNNSYPFLYKISIFCPILQKSSWRYTPTPYSHGDFCKTGQKMDILHILRYEIIFIKNALKK